MRQHLLSASEHDIWGYHCESRKRDNSRLLAEVTSRVAIEKVAGDIVPKT
jgi:hypothetical protein